MSIAYALRAEYHDTYVGGVLALGDTSLDVRQALQDGGGVILVEETDTMRTVTLDEYPPLQRIDPPAAGTVLPVGYVDPDPPPKPVEIPIADLRARAKTLGVESPGRSREEITAAIAAAEAAAAPAPTVPDATPEG